VCNPERSEGSDSRNTEILRCAQDDMTEVGRENSLSRPYGGIAHADPGPVQMCYLFRRDKNTSRPTGKNVTPPALMRSRFSKKLPINYRSK